MAPKQHLVVGTASPQGGVLTLRLAAPQWVSSEAGHEPSPPPAPDAPGLQEELLSPPDPRQLHIAIQNGNVAASDSKKLRTLRQLQSHLAYLQRQQGLPTGLCGGWNSFAQEKLDAWLLSDLRGSSSRGTSPSPLPLEDVKPDEGEADSPEPPHKKRKSASHQIAKTDDESADGDVKGNEPDEVQCQASHQIAKTDDESADGDVKGNEPDEVQCQASHQIANTDDESADGHVKGNEPDEVQCQEVCSPTASDNEQASEDSSSSSSSSESTKVRRGNLDKVMSCLESLQEVNPDCEDCARIISEAKAHLKACL